MPRMRQVANLQIIELTPLNAPTRNYWDKKSKNQSDYLDDKLL